MYDIGVQCILCVVVVVVVTAAPAAAAAAAAAAVVEVVVVVVCLSLEHLLLLSVCSFISLLFVLPSLQYHFTLTFEINSL